MEALQAVVDAVATYGPLIGVVILLLRFVQVTPTKDDMNKQFGQVNRRIDKLTEKVAENTNSLMTTA